MVTIILICLILIFIIFRPSEPETINIQINNNSYNLEIAKTISQKSKGLSQRNNLCQNCGMIFVFPTDSIWPFWMKDTFIPLDIIWINKENKIVSIQTAQPEYNVSQSQLKIYKNDIPAKFVIEINANQAQQLNLKVGDYINLTNLSK